MLGETVGGKNQKAGELGGQWEGEDLEGGRAWGTVGSLETWDVTTKKL